MRPRCSSGYTTIFAALAYNSSPLLSLLNTPPILYYKGSALYGPPGSSTIPASGNRPRLTAQVSFLSEPPAQGTHGGSAWFTDVTRTAAIVIPRGSTLPIAEADQTGPDRNSIYLSPNVLPRDVIATLFALETSLRQWGESRFGRGF